MPRAKNHHQNYPPTRNRGLFIKVLSRIPRVLQQVVFHGSSGSCTGGEFYLGMFLQEANVGMG